MNFKEPICFSR